MKKETSGRSLGVWEVLKEYFNLERQLAEMERETHCGAFEHSERPNQLHRASTNPGAGFPLTIPVTILKLGVWAIRLALYLFLFSREANADHVH